MSDQPGCCDEDYMNRSDRRDSAGQSADLRTRIKHLLDTHRCDDCTDDPPDWTGHLAGVLVRELGMVREYSIGDDEGGRVLWFDDEEPVAPREGEVVEVRYITGWTASG